MCGLLMRSHMNAGQDRTQSVHAVNCASAALSLLGSDAARARAKSRLSVSDHFDETGVSAQGI